MSVTLVIGQQSQRQQQFESISMLKVLSHSDSLYDRCLAAENIKQCQYEY
jgi:hypothetical protein